MTISQERYDMRKTVGNTSERSVFDSFKKPCHTG